MSILSLWLQNRFLLQGTDECTLQNHADHLIKLLGGWKGVLELCLRDRHILKWRQQHQLSLFLKDTIREQSEHNECGSGNFETSIRTHMTELNIDCLLYTLSFLTATDTNNVSMTGRAMYYRCCRLPIVSQKPFSFGSSFRLLYGYDPDQIYEGLKQQHVLLSKNNTVSSQRSVSKLYAVRMVESGVHEQLLTLTIDIKDQRINTLAMRCIESICEYPEAAQHFGKHTRSLIDILSADRIPPELVPLAPQPTHKGLIPSTMRVSLKSGHSTNTSAVSALRTMKMSALSTMTSLITNCYIKLDEEETSRIIKILVEDILQNRCYQYDYKVLGAVLLLILSICKYNTNGLNDKHLLKMMVTAMKEKLTEYVAYYYKEWIYHLDITGIEIQNLLFLLHPTQHISHQQWHQCRSQQELIRFYDPSKVKIFGIRNGNQQGLDPYHDDDVAHCPLLIAAILEQLGALHSIPLDPKVVLSILRTLSMSNFRWISSETKRVHDDYQFRRRFLMPLIVTDLNLLLHDEIIQYLTTLHPEDIDHLFWKMGKENASNIMQHFLSKMDDLDLFIEKCFTSPPWKPYQGVVAFVALLCTTHKQIGCYKIRQVIEQCPPSQRVEVLVFLLLDTKCVQYLYDLLAANNQNVFLGIRLTALLIRCMSTISVQAHTVQQKMVRFARYQQFKEVEEEMHQRLCDRVSALSNSNMFRLPKDLQDYQYRTQLSMMTLLYEAIKDHPSIVTVIRKEPFLVSLILCSRLEQSQVDSYATLVVMAMVITERSVISEVLKAYSDPQCESFLVSWFNNTARHCETLEKMIADSGVVLRATGFMIAECIERLGTALLIEIKRAHPAITSRLSNFFLNASQSDNKALADKILKWWIVPDTRTAQPSRPCVERIVPRFPFA